MITGGSLEYIKILANFIPQSINSNEKSFGVKGLTGCLNLIDVKIQELDIELQNSNCEDGINIIRSKGSINNLILANSSNDALDIDFSDIKISKVKIDSAGNDCVDLSFGMDLSLGVDEDDLPSVIVFFGVFCLVDVEVDVAPLIVLRKSYSIPKLASFFCFFRKFDSALAAFFFCSLFFFFSKKK